MPYLSESDRQSLLQFAREAVVKAVSLRELPKTIPHEGIFDERRGVFVTLHVGGTLRGCIGVAHGDEPLGEALVRCAASAATHDTRFLPVRVEELGDLQIEISLLSALIPIRPDEIEIGRHGLVISQGERRGLLLPQVATEHGLTREEFLDETCRKAGLPREAWRSMGTRIEGFTCEILSEGKKFARP